MAHYFFEPTRSATDQIADLFGFVWPTAAALWNLRWQVQGFLDALDAEPTPEQLNDRFVFGSGIHGTNLKRACVETSWDEQKHHLANIILTNAFAVYEHWADEILVCVGMADGKGKLLQFDYGPNDPRGLRGIVNQICASESEVMKKAFYPAYASSPKYSWPLMANLVACYRYFKELRNAQIHNGGTADLKAANAYTAFAPVSSKTDLGMKGVLVHDPIAEGDRINLHIRGVVGFCDILFRMMVTIDAEFSRCSIAERLLEDRLKEVKRNKMLSGIPNRRRMQIIDRCKAARLPKPHDFESVRTFMISKRMVYI